MARHVVGHVQPPPAKWPRPFVPSSLASGLLGGWVNHLIICTSCLGGTFWVEILGINLGPCASGMY